MRLKEYVVAMKTKAENNVTRANEKLNVTEEEKRNARVKLKWWDEIAGIITTISGKSLSVADLIDFMLRESHTTEMDVSRATGLNNGAISSARTGRSIPNCRTLLTIADYCGYELRVVKKDA